MTHLRFNKITAIEYKIQYIYLVRDFIFNNGNFILVKRARVMSFIKTV